MFTAIYNIHAYRIKHPTMNLLKVHKLNHNISHKENGTKKGNKEEAE